MDNSTIRQATLGVLLLLVMPASSGGQTPDLSERPGKRVLIVSDIPRNANTHQLLERALMSVLQTEVVDPVNLYTEHLDVMRFPEHSRGPAFATFLQTKYASVPPSAVVTFGPYSLSYMIEHGPRIFPGVPVVFVGGRVPERQRPAFLTGVTERPDYAAIVELALQLQPETERVFVVHGAAEFDLPWGDEARQDLAPLKNRVAVQFLAGLPMKQLDEKLAVLPARSVVLYLPISQDGDRINWSVWSALERVSGSANAPVYAWHEVAIGNGAVAIRGPDLQEMGVSAGQKVVRILRGTVPSDIPIVQTRARNVLDWHALQRWQIDLSRIPAGSVIRNRPPSAWEQYRTQILVAMSVLLLQTVLIIALLLQSARRRKAEALARRAEAALRTSYDQVQDLARRLNTAQEVERARIARELHDDVNQQLAVVAIRLSDLNRRLPDNELRSKVEWLQQRAGILIETVRSMSHDLHPGILQQAGLIAALRGMCSQISTEHGLVVDLLMPEEFPDLPAATSLGIFRIAQEALNNVARHARATRAELRLRHDSGWVQLEVSDDGSGLQSNVTGKPGLGTLSMQERARLLGGELLIGSAASGGTHVSLRVPLAVPEMPPETPVRVGASGPELLIVSS